jgi:hypothetical protein
MVAQERRVIRDRYQHEDRDQQRHPQAPRAMAQVTYRIPAREAVMNEQSRDQEHEGHEEAVVEQHDQIEAEPADPIAVAEIGVVDDGMVDDH